MPGVESGVVDILISESGQSVTAHYEPPINDNWLLQALPKKYMLLGASHEDGPELPEQTRKRRPIKSLTIKNQELHDTEPDPLKAAAALIEVAGKLGYTEGAIDYAKPEDNVEAHSEDSTAQGLGDCDESILDEFPDVHPQGVMKISTLGNRVLSVFEPPLPVEKFYASVPDDLSVLKVARNEDKINSALLGLGDNPQQSIDRLTDIAAINNYGIKMVEMSVHSKASAFRAL